MTTSRLKKPNAYASDDAARRIGSKVSKMALLDVAWNLATLGTNETEEEILTKLAREVVLVCEGRGDQVPRGLREIAARSIDSDPEWTS